MKLQKGFGQISLISIVAIPALVFTLIYGGIKSYTKWQQYEEEKKELISDIAAQRAEFLELRESFNRSQRGIDTLRSVTDDITRSAKQSSLALTRLELERQAELDPDSTAKMLNELNKKQISDLVKITQKDWDPLVDKKKK